ncbi:GlxA family transcriptional regulator [Nonomuraea sp. SBT364]|uniref:GlxA family transcriptional regulator n=1 Tax=Nonomuraea sp. SBT364 TaxID=1580530 RepID=UPI000AC881A3|nr:helix-turn-helix domain-containing protein [Nonomuraea sp. SBT364]
MMQGNLINGTSKIATREPSSQARTPFRSVLAYARPGVSSFGLSAISNLFADRSDKGLPRLDFAVCSDGAGALRTDLGLCLQVEHGPEAMAGADLIIVLPTEGRPLTLPMPARRAIIDAHRRGAVVSAYCTGSFLLAGTGLLDGLRATTNWRLAAQLAHHHPAITVEPGLLYVDEGRVVTGAAAAAGIDMCLHLLRREHGQAVSSAVAAEAMHTPRHESGLPAQADPPSYAAGEAARLTGLLTWARTRLHQPLTVDDLAGQALMSSRTFARRFRAATGTTPHAWLTAQRLDRARVLLETTDLSIHEIAVRVGFQSSSVLRAQFGKHHGLSPRAYRHASARPAR